MKARSYVDKTQQNIEFLSFGELVKLFVTVQGEVKRRIDGDPKFKDRFLEDAQALLKGIS
jgi:hypothetical protein